MKRFAILLIFFILYINGLTAQEWLTNIDEVTVLAQKENKNIIMVFAGSDWCAPCIKLEKNILETEKFSHYATSHWVLLRLDFPKRKNNKLPKEQQIHNDKLAEKYNKKGYFPLVLVLDKNGTVLGETGYKDISPQAYIDELITFEK